MSQFETRTTKPPRSVIKLVREFQDQLSLLLGRNLVGAYMHGSVAFPDYDPHSGDLDFYAVVRRPLTKSDIGRLGGMHRRLAARFDYGSRLDGFYIPLAKARRPLAPKRLVYSSHGRIDRGEVDDAWALHREHLHHGAYIRLHGPNPSRIFSSADWPSLRSDLYRQLVYARKIVDSDPWWAVLNLCRLIYSFEQGRVVVSKLGAARWALRRLPMKWHRVIRSAVKAYKGRAGNPDRIVLRRDARKFLGFASVRVIAYDTTWDSSKPHIKQLRETR